MRFLSSFTFATTLNILYILRSTDSPPPFVTIPFQSPLPSPPPPPHPPLSITQSLLLPPLSSINLSIPSPPPASSPSSSRYNQQSGVYDQRFLTNKTLPIHLSIFCVGGFLSMLLILWFPNNAEALWIGMFIKL